MSEHKSPVEQLVDLLVYAPVGAAVTAQERLPELIGKGHDRLAGRVATARVFGQFAVAQGRKEADRLAKQAAGLLSGLGILPQPGRSSTRPVPTPGEPSSTSTRSSTATAEAGRTGGSASSGDGAAATTNGSAAPAPTSVSGRASGMAHRGSRVGAAASVPASADLAIPGYDSLSASHVVQRLAGLAPGELEAVRVYESGTRGRRTILSRIAQLQAEQRHG